MNLAKIVHHAKEEPLAIDLALTPQCKSIKFLAIAHVAKDRLDGSHAFIVEETTFNRIHLTFHLIDESLRGCGGPTLYIMDLTGGSAIRIT